VRTEKKENEGKKEKENEGKIEEERSKIECR
jgi:hypothetical protein